MLTLNPLPDANPFPFMDAERRQSPRRRFHPLAGCLVAVGGGKSAAPVRVKNISTGGLLLDLAERVLPGEVLTVTLYDKALGSRKVLQARVVSIGFTSGGRFRVGCAFARPLSEEEVRAFL